MTVCDQVDRIDEFFDVLLSCKPMTTENIQQMAPLPLFSEQKIDLNLKLMILCCLNETNVIGMPSLETCAMELNGK